jgi:hypothetical protein
MVKVSLRRGEGHLRAALVAGRADHRERRHRVAVVELHEMLVAAAPDAQLERDRERVDDRDADAVQAARDLVGILVELSAGMELGHDDLGGGNAFLAVDIDRNAAAIVRDGHGTRRRSASP